MVAVNGRGDVQVILGMPISIFSWDGFSHVLMPAVNLALFKLSMVIRLARAEPEKFCTKIILNLPRLKDYRSPE